MKVFRFIFLLLLTFFISSCDEGIESKTDLYYPISQTDSDTVKFAQVQSLFQDNGCFGCHSGTYPFGDFDLDVPLSDLISLKSNFSDTKTNIITPGNPEQSTLYLALLGEADGVRKMPLNNKQMDKEDIATIKKWIEQGALDN